MKPLPPGKAAALACLSEVSAPKPGNVHRAADFDDLTFQDFAISAVCVGAVFAHAPLKSVGWLVRQSVQSIHDHVGRNTYLGTLLLLAPLAKCEFGTRDASRFPAQVGRALAGLTSQDAQEIYAAIRLARPAGLGNVDEFDVAGPAPPDLLSAMRAAADRDQVARQYVTDFTLVLGEVVPELLAGSKRGWSLPNAIVHAHVKIMAKYPDSLIARKLGTDLAEEARQRAELVAHSAPPWSDTYLERLAELDFWLRADGHRRNPGTTADLIAAGVFVLLRSGFWKGYLR
ncbi:MAG TPA: triphosphoribosyl-dephospho-CoA synthase [Pirellulaceae bacterium]